MRRERRNSLDNYPVHTSTLTPASNGDLGANPSTKRQSEQDCRYTCLTIAARHAEPDERYKESNDRSDDTTSNGERRPVLIEASIVFGQKIARLWRDAARHRGVCLLRGRSRMDFLLQ